MFVVKAWLIRIKHLESKGKVWMKREYQYKEMFMKWFLDDETSL